MANPGKQTPPGIVQMYQRGMSLPKMAAKTGCSVSFLHARLLAMGVSMRKSGGAENGRLATIKKAHENLKRRQQRNL